MKGGAEMLFWLAALTAVPCVSTAWALYAALGGAWRGASVILLATLLLTPWLVREAVKPPEFRR